MSQFFAKIEKINNKGLGFFRDEEKELSGCVPFSLPGDLVEYSINQDKTLNIIGLQKNSSDRVIPLCPQFGKCGGCSLQHASDSFILDWKESIVRCELKKKSINTTFRKSIVLANFSRRRAKFTGRRTKKGVIVGFHKRFSHTITPIEGCLILDKSLLSFSDAMKKITLLTCSRSSKLVFHLSKCERGLDVHLEGVKKITVDIKSSLIEIAREFEVSRLTCDGELIALFEKPFQNVGNIRIYPPNLFFMQATKAAERLMISNIKAAMANQKEVADLFSGCGAFSLALGKEKKVTAYDNAPSMLEALNEAYKRNSKLKTIKISVRNLLKEPLTRDELSRFDGAIINPPRGGALLQAAELAKSNVKTIISISCNPETFARDSEILIKGGYRIDWLQIIDQFKWSHHIELISQFSKKG